MDNDSSPKAVLGDHNDFPAGTKTEEQFAFVIERLRMKKGTFWCQDHQKGPRTKKNRAKSKNFARSNRVQHPKNYTETIAFATGTVGK